MIGGERRKGRVNDCCYSACAPHALGADRLTYAARALLLTASVAFAGCAEPADDSVTLTVFAASSLTEAFGDLDQAFEAAYPNVRVSSSFAGSQVLRVQIEEGAPADVYASAEREHMDALLASGHIEDEVLFARNDLVLIVPLANPAHLERFEDLPNAERLVIGDANAPVGRYTREVLMRAGSHFGGSFELDVLAHVVSMESNVRLVRAKVELGEADAAIVYRTDAMASDRVRVIDIPADLNVQADYFIARASRSEHADLARGWIAFTSSEAGQRALVARGFISVE